MTTTHLPPTLTGDQLQKPSATAEVHRIIIKPAYRKNGTMDCVEAGPRYHSLFKNEIICTSTEPFLDSARALQALGYKGNIEMWHSGSDFPSMKATLEHAAGITVSENERTLTFVSYIAFSGKPQFMFAADATEAKAKLAAMTPSEREGVIMFHWLPVQEHGPASTLPRPDV